MRTTSATGEKVVKKTICPLDCPDSCAMLATIENSKVVSLRGDPDHPYTNGFICRKMRSYHQRLYSPERLLYPQLRVGAKGAGSFKRISWSRALDICAEKFSETVSEYGSQAILPYCYAGNMGMANRFAGFPFFHRLGALQLEQTICSAAAGAGWKKQCGKRPGSPPENAAKARLIIAWGINLRVTNIHFWQYVRAARKEGAKLLVIDPYRNHTARLADEYIQLHPGGDLGLALGISKLLVESGRVDEQWISSSSQGFDHFAAYLRRCSLSQCIGESGVELEVMKQLADQLAGCKRTFLRIGIGLTRHSRGAMAVRCITSLAALLGLFAGGRGRGVLLSSGAFSGDKELLVGKKLLAQESETVNMIHLGSVLNRGQSPVKALMVYNSNPVSVSPDAALVRKGLRREDLFTVVHEQLMTPTAAYADLLLPATTFLENLDLYGGYGHFYLGVARPVIEPLGEAKSNFELFQSLAAKMGFDDALFKQTVTQRIRNYLLSIPELPEDTDIERVLEGDYVLSTNSMVQPDRESPTAPKLRFLAAEVETEPPVACLTRAAESVDPDLLGRFPLRLITPPHPQLLNSTFGERYPGKPGELLVHPRDAERYGITDGHAVSIANHRGKTRRIARVTDDTAKGVVVAEGIFWPVAVDDGSEVESGINELTSQKITDMGNGATFHESLVSISAANS